MEDQQKLAEPRPTPAALLILARELKDAAVIAGRPDVAAKADEAVALITGTNDAVGTGVEERDGDKPNTVVRILDGLGL